MKPYWTSSCGRWTVYHGDCLEVLPGLEAGSVDAVVTDPPYGIGLKNGDVDGHRSDHWDAIIGDESEELGVGVLARFIGVVTVVAFSSPWKPWPGYWRNMIVWDKGGAVGGGGDIATCLKRSWELVQVHNLRPYSGTRSESVWRFPVTPQDANLHIAAKPPLLVARLLNVFTSSEETILDPFLGSGTTLVACVKTGRRGIGIEIDERYCEIAAKRIEAEAHHLFAEVG